MDGQVNLMAITMNKIHEVLGKPKNVRPRKNGEFCNCENGQCDHEEGCGNLAGDTYIDQLGYVCVACGNGYPKEYHISIKRENQ
jgi:hypothetical protein